MDTLMKNFTEKESEIMPISFKTFDTQAAIVTAAYFARQDTRMSDYTVGVSYLWQEYFDCRYAIVADCLILSVVYDGERYFTFPIGTDVDAALDALDAHCAESDERLQFATVSPAQSVRLRERYPDARVTEQRSFFDYLYHYSDLATFAGRRYSAQRNHINQFVKAAPDWAYEPLTADRIPATKAFLHDLCRRREELQGGPLSTVEQADEKGSYALLDAMPTWQAAGIPITGGMITVGDTIVALSVGEIQNDTLYVHIEKGDMRYPGVYQMMVREYAAHTVGATYINREDDAGDEGLRRSKMAYRPCEILEKFIVTKE